MGTPGRKFNADGLLLKSGGVALGTGCCYCPACVNCLDCTSCTILMTVTGMVLCSGCIGGLLDGAHFGKWRAGADLNQTVCLHQSGSDHCVYSGTINADLDIYSDNACSMLVQTLSVVSVGASRTATGFIQFGMTHQVGVTVFSGSTSVADCAAPFTLADTFFKDCSAGTLIDAVSTGSAAGTPGGC